MTLDPALNVRCPTCRAKAGEPCISRHAISVHQARRAALRKLERQASAILARDQEGQAKGRNDDHL